MLSTTSLEEITTICEQKIRKMSDMRADLNLEDPDNEVEINHRLKDNQYYQGLKQDVSKLADIYYRELYGKEKTA